MFFACWGRQQLVCLRRRFEIRSSSLLGNTKRATPASSAASTRMAVASVRRRSFIRQASGVTLLLARRDAGRQVHDRVRAGDGGLHSRRVEQVEVAAAARVDLVACIAQE